MYNIHRDTIITGSSFNKLFHEPFSVELITINWLDYLYRTSIRHLIWNKVVFKIHKIGTHACMTDPAHSGFNSPNPNFKFIYENSYPSLSFLNEFHQRIHTWEKVLQAYLIRDRVMFKIHAPAWPIQWTSNLTVNRKKSVYFITMDVPNFHRLLHATKWYFHRNHL